MATVKESLKNAIENLSDDEAQKVMEFIEVMQKEDMNLETLRRLSGDTAFRLPSQGIGEFNLSNQFKVLVFQLPNC